MRFLGFCESDGESTIQIMISYNDVPVILATQNLTTTTAATMMATTMATMMTTTMPQKNVNDVDVRSKNFQKIGRVDAIDLVQKSSKSEPSS